MQSNHTKNVHKLCLIMTNYTGKSIEHAYWNVFNTLSQAFAGDDSFLYGGTSHMHFSGTILVHS